MKHLRLALAAAAATLAAAPALAQAVYDPSVSEVTVLGHRGLDGRPNTLSRVINISDLDLRYDTDVREMQARIRSTARSLCEELGETGGPGVGPSCTDQAVRDAQRQTRIAVAAARAPTYYAYAPPPAYAPYVGDYAPPASATVPQTYPDGTPYSPPDL